MEQKRNNEAQAEIEVKRERVASWIRDSLRPVDRLMKYDGLFPSSSPDIENIAPQFEVREYQLDAWGAIWDARQCGETHGLVHLATGLGKTSVAVFDAKKFREEFRVKHGRDPKIMFTVHQNDILAQAADRFRAFIPDASMGYYNGKEKSIDTDITLATFQSLHANLDSLDPKAFDYIIDDEVHHAKAHTYEKVVKHFKPQFRLGLTATPNRADEKDIREIYGQELYSKGLPEALAEGWLATPEYHIVFDDAVKEAMQSGFEANSLKALKELFDAKPRNDTIADNIREEMKKIGLEFGSVKTIVFCQDIEHADEMAQLLSGKAYHSETDSQQRKDVFDEFKNGDLQVITTRDMFNEGVDVPDARLLVFLRSTSSQTIFEQQLGRGLRKAEGKDRVSVLDFVANVERIAMVKELANEARKISNANNSSDDDLSDNDNDLEPTGNGFVIHTNHGEFDFDKMVVDLLERYNAILVKDPLKFMSFSNKELLDLSLELIPDRAITVSDLEKLSRERLFTNPSTTASRFGSLRIFNELRGFDISGPDRDEIIARALELSPDEPLTTPKIEELSKNGTFVSTHIIYDRFGSVREFQCACGFNIDRLSNLSDEEIINLALELSPDQPLTRGRIDQLASEKLFIGGNTIKRRFGSIEAFGQACGFEVILSAPDDVVSLPSYARTLGVAASTLEKRILDAGIELPQYRFNGAGVSLGLDVDNQKIAGNLIENPSKEDDNGVKSVSAFGKEVGISKEYFYKVLKERNIAPGRYKIGSNIADGLTTEQQNLILKDPTIIKRPPAGVVSINAFAKSIGENFTSIKNIIIQNDIILPKYKFGPKESEGLDEAAQILVKHLHESRPKMAPEGYRSATGLARDLGVDKRKITNVMAELGDRLGTCELYFFGKRGAGKPAPGLSPDQQMMISDYINGR